MRKLKKQNIAGGTERKASKSMAKRTEMTRLPRYYKRPLIHPLKMIGPDLENLSVSGPAEPYEAIENIYPGSRKYSRYRVYIIYTGRKE